VTTTDLEPGLLRISPGLLLGKLGRAVYVIVSEALKPMGLTPRQAGTLYMLREQPRTQQELIDAVGVDPSKMVGVLNELETAGLLLRRRDPIDRRRHIVEISEEGKTRLASAERAVAIVEEHLLAGLDETRRADLHALLRHVAENAGLSGCAELGGRSLGHAELDPD
jgi:DNA-binding MarR family transcriptional regulator